MEVCTLNANTTRQLCTFIATSKGSFDPEILVAQAQEILNFAIARKDALARQQTMEAAMRVYVQHLQEIRRQAEE